MAAGVNIITRPVIRVFAWLALLAIVTFTISPLEFRPNLGHGANLDRVLGFFLTGSLFGTGYPRQRLQALFFILFVAGGLELSQMLTPDRHANLFDAGIKAAAGALGVAVGAAISEVAVRLRRW